MKKLRVSLCMGAAVLAAALVGCNQNENTGVPDIRNDLFAPTAYSLGDELYWSACAGAVSYEIYEGDTKVSTVTEIGYRVGETSVDLEYRVKAKYTTGTSDYSNATTVSKNIGFSDDEILVIDENDVPFTKVAASVRKVVLEREEPTDVFCVFAIAERETDLTFSLKNVTLKKTPDEYFSPAVISTVSVSYSRSEQDWSLILEAEGACTIDGYIKDEPHYVPDTNSGEDGNRGRDGASAVYVSSVVVRGSGTLTLKGGDGQDGTRGASATALSTATYGHGGDGGNGGAPLFCQYLLIDFENAESALTLFSGAPGKAGGRGSDPKPLTSSVKHFYCVGTDCDGKDGGVTSGVINNKIIKNGIVTDETK